MIRWSYLIPRLLILGLITLAIWIGTDPLIRFALIKTGENTIGAKVDVAQVRTSLYKGKLYLKDLKIADPRNPMLNLVQADMAYIKLDPRQLLHREIVIENGKTSKVQFGAPRTESGALPDRTYENESAYQPIFSSVIAENVEHAADQLLEQFQNNMSLQVENSFESIRLARELKESWPATFEAHKSKIVAIQDQLKAMTEVVSGDDSNNPLRTGHILNALGEAQTLRIQIGELRSELSLLQRKALADRDALLAAREVDQQKIRQVVRNAEFDSQGISKLLLSETQSKYVNELVQWFRWFRSTVPNPEEDFYPIRQRGVDIPLNGIQSKPRFVIKSLDIDGEGRLAGRHFNFVGEATNISTQPKLHDQPIGFQLRAQGQQHLIVGCELDRRQDRWVDKLNVQCPDLSIDSQKLGNNESIAISMGPSRLQVEVSLQAIDDQLSGELVFHHHEVLMHVDEVNEMVGGKDVALRLNQDLAAVDRFQTYVAISGTLEKPVIELHSDLGTKFAAAINHVLAERIQAKIEENQQRFEKAFQQELAELDRTIESNLADISNVLSQEADIIAQLKKFVPRSSSRPRR